MMMDYSLADLTPKSKQRQGRVILPGIEESNGARRAYQAELRKMLVGIRAETAPIVERYARDRAFRDADEFWFNSLAAMAAKLAFHAEKMVYKIIGLEAKRHTETFVRHARRVLGIDLTALIHQEDLADLVRSINGRNASLIRSLSDDAKKRVEQAVYESWTSGQTAKELQGRLKREFGVLDRRAKLIARDQMAKMNADFNQRRHVQAGITSYIWTTSHDERVRTLHRSLDGRQYKYGKPTGAEGGMPPGKPIVCRCIARAVVEF
ncbi:hypothetical protein CSC94_12680 [Zhengella mangrovi]|uniref:Phage head morphogenesis domain-containing protein n=1 Tax=Zhengella mangrovi TaxID=1982044 RepID=A0A2G1QM41_9HYPH|nr:minor capsid protein [Zhengella mangrovi]PHP66539.1 hypothetical protein CSC94_12680 [Zhengella mangrovi]